MAVTVRQLAAELRINDGTADPPEPHLSMLTRLLGVSDAMVEQIAPEAPESIKDEAQIRFCSYSFDMPSSARGTAFADIWRNSGAAGLVARWVVRRAGVEATAAAATPGSVPVAGGLDQAEVQALIDASGHQTAAQVQAAITAALANLQTGGQTAQQVQAAIAAEIAKLDIPAPYVLPAATSTTRGGVKAITNNLITDGTSTGIFGWAISHVKRVAQTIADSAVAAVRGLPAGGTAGQVARVASNGTDLEWSGAASDRAVLHRLVAVTNEDKSLAVTDYGSHFRYTTGNVNRTLTLPAEEKPGDTIGVVKLDAGTGKVLIKRNNGALLFEVVDESDPLIITWTGVRWLATYTTDAGAHDHDDDPRLDHIDESIQHIAAEIAALKLIRDFEDDWSEPTRGSYELGWFRSGQGQVSGFAAASIVVPAATNLRPSILLPSGISPSIFRINSDSGDIWPMDGQQWVRVGGTGDNRVYWSVAGSDRTPIEVTTSQGDEWTLERDEVTTRLLVGVESLAAAVVKRLLPAALGSKGQALVVNAAADGVEYGDVAGSGPKIPTVQELPFLRMQGHSGNNLRDTGLDLDDLPATGEIFIRITDSQGSHVRRTTKAELLALTAVTGTNLPFNLALDENNNEALQIGSGEASANGHVGRWAQNNHLVAQSAAGSSGDWTIDFLHELNWPGWFNQGAVVVANLNSTGSSTAWRKFNQIDGRAFDASKRPFLTGNYGAHAFAAAFGGNNFIPAITQQNITDGDGGRLIRLRGDETSQPLAYWGHLDGFLYMRTSTALGASDNASILVFQDT